MLFESSSLRSDTEMADRDPSPQENAASGFRQQAPASLTPAKRLKLSVILPRGFHPFPSRTRKLSPAGPMVLHAKVCGRVGRCRHKIKAMLRNQCGLFLLRWDNRALDLPLRIVKRDSFEASLAPERFAATSGDRENGT